MKPRRLQRLTIFSIRWALGSFVDIEPKSLVARPTKAKRMRGLRDRRFHGIAMQLSAMNPQNRSPYINALGGLIFFSRWLQAPLYVGLIMAQAVYVYRFFVELFHLLAGVQTMQETDILGIVLGLIDVVMIANLLVMVIVGGYETFVSRLNLKGHPDEPEWLSHVNAGVLKVKLATALIGISSVQLLRTFVQLGSNADVSERDIFWQVMVHLTFVLSALLLAITDRITTTTSNESRAAH